VQLAAAHKAVGQVPQLQPFVALPAEQQGASSAPNDPKPFAGAGAGTGVAVASSAIHSARPGQNWNCAGAGQ
jgi:hypothetical protein